jgi:hypothetical protein
MGELTLQLSRMQKQAEQLRDEKDVLLARLVIENKIQPEEKSEKPSTTTVADDSPKAQVAEEAAAPQVTPPPGKTVEQIKPQHAVVAEAPKIKIAAQIKQFEVLYDRDRAMLEARFRIYNDNQPKVPLSGRVVVIFKKEQDPPLKWMPVPVVQISNGTPDGTRGQIFKIQNYRTMSLKAYGLKQPIVYDTAAIYIFSDDGELILTEDHEFEIAAPAASSPQKRPDTVQYPRSSQQEESTEVPDGEDKEDEAESPTDSASPSSDVDQKAYPDPYGATPNSGSTVALPGGSKVSETQTPVPSRIDEATDLAAPKGGTK